MNGLNVGYRAILAHHLVAKDNLVSLLHSFAVILEEEIRAIRSLTDIPDVDRNVRLVLESCRNFDRVFLS